MNENDVILARKCHSVQKRKKKTAAVCFFVRSKDKTEFCGRRSQAADTNQKGRRQNNIAWSKLLHEAKQFIESTFVLNWPECDALHSRASFTNFFVPLYEKSKNTKHQILLEIQTSCKHSPTISTC